MASEVTQSKVVAVIATYNEERFLSGCIEHYRQQGVDVFLIDNDSTDDTVDIAHSYLGCGVVGIKSLKRNGCFSLEEQLIAKEQVVRELNADWVIHADADEIRLPPRSDQTLATALAQAADAGFNAINFLEFTFVPTQEHPDHEHPHFADTMRWYYHFAPRHPFHIKAWKPAELPDFDLASSGGHILKSRAISLSPIDFKFRHYLFLSAAHAQRKYVEKHYDADELDRGWHGWRARITTDTLVLQSESSLQYYTCDNELDTSNPVTSQHPIYQHQT